MDTVTKYSRSRAMRIGSVLAFAAVAAILLASASAGPRDSNDPNYPIADTNGDLRVDISDLSYTLDKWGTNDSRANFTGNSSVDIQDLSYLLAQWGRVDQPVDNTPLVIYDTDMGPDIDDAVALAMLHSYRDEGKIELAAVTISRGSSWGARYSDAVNTLYGRPTIPIGIYRGGTVESTTNANDGYAVLANNYPHDVHYSTIPDGYKVQREVLARAERENRRVIIIQTGFSGNVSQLLNSGGDSISSKSGKDLIRSRVDVLAIMAGRFNTSQVEFNVQKDLSSAQNVIRNWPVDMVLSDWNVGAGVIYPYYSGIRDIYAQNHPVRAAYEKRVLSWHRDIDPNPPSDPNRYNMVSWDLTSVLDGIEPGANYFGKSGWGTINIDGRGVTTFSQGSGRHRILYVPSDKQRTINRMIQLAR